MFLSLFSLSLSAQRGILESNIIYVGENNMSEVLADKAACLLLVTTDTDDEKFKTLSDFTSAAEILGTRCFFGIMNGERNYKFKKANKIKSEKSYFFFRYGILITQFTGKSTTEGLIDFAMSKTGIPFKTFDDYVTAQDFIEAHDCSVVLYTKSAKGKVFENFNSIAMTMRDNISFGFCPDEDISLELEIDDLPSLVLYRNQDRSKIFYPEDFAKSSVEDVISWIKYNVKPFFVPFNLKNQKDYIGKNPVCLFFTPVDVEQKQATFEFITKLAKQFNQDLIFAQIDAVTGNRFMTGLGFSKYADPAVCILDYKSNVPKRYLYDEEADWTFDSVAGFIMDFLDGKLTPVIKSSTLPNDNNGPLFEINANNMEETLQQQKDVLVLYYESWDRIYTDFLPLFEELANYYQDKIVFTKINVAENDLIFGKKPKKTPCLILYNRDNQALIYKGNLNKKSIINFLSDETDIISEL